MDCFGGRSPYCQFPAEAGPSVPVEVLGLIENIEQNPTLKFKVMKEQLCKITTMTLKRKLKELNENVSGDKHALWLRLFSKILDRSLETESQDCDSQKYGAISTDSITGGLSFPTMPMENQMSLAMWKPLPIIWMI